MGVPGSWKLFARVTMMVELSSPQELMKREVVLLSPLKVLLL